jgi:hypothetical protein
MSRLTKLALIVGYLSLAGAALAAHLSPSAGYELSIYTATPIVFWGAVALALAVALVVAYTAGGTVRSAALVLAVFGFYLIVSLPLTRGYYFYGPADSLTHLGWVKDLQAGRMNVLDLLYPGIHTTTIFTSVLSAETPRRAMLVFVSLFPVAFVLFTFLTVRAVTTRYTDVVTAVFAALLLLPINHITTHYMSPHPITDSIMLTPFALYIFARYVTNVEREQTITKVGVLFGVFSIAIVLYHPMQALHLLILFAGVALVQFYVRQRYDVASVASASLARITRHRPVYAQTGFLGALFALWSLNHETVRRTALSFIVNLDQVLAGTDQSGAVVRQRTGSLSAIGVTPVEIGAKLFLPSLIFCAIAGILMLGVFRGRLAGSDSDADAYIEYLSVALVGLIGFNMFVLAAGDVSKLFFRTLGAVMAVVTILGVLAVPRLLSWLSRPPKQRVRQVGAIVSIALLLVATVAIVYPSPYIYKTNRMVDEQQITGHEMLFEHEVPGSEIASPRVGPYRSYHAIYGVETSGARASELDDNRISYGNLSRLQAESAFESDYYLAISEKDRLREVSVYRELRYTATGFDSLDWQVDVHRPISNGEFHSYLVDKGGASA